MMSCPFFLQGLKKKQLKLANRLIKKQKQIKQAHSNLVIGREEHGLVWGWFFFAKSFCMWGKKTPTAYGLKAQD